MIIYVPYLFAIALALLCAWQDARDIKIGNEIYHKSAWVGRAGLVTVMVLGAFCFTNHPMWVFFAALAGNAFLFSGVFRLLLNTLCKEPWWYMGPHLGYRNKKDSKYDAAWHWIAWKFHGGRLGPTFGRPVYGVATPAKLAFAFEALVLIASVVLTATFGTP